jgi:hypothetical protein
MRVAPYPGDVATTAELLADVTTAIQALVSGRLKRTQVSTGGTVRDFTYLDLPELRAWRKDLLAQLAAETQGGMRVRLARPSF